MSFQKWKSSDQSINIIDTKFKKNFDTVNILYEHSLKNLIIVLNQIHNLKEERRFWETLLGAWLSSFVNQCHVEFIKKKTLVANNNIKIHNYYDYEEYNRFLSNDYFRYNLSKAIRFRKLNIEIIDIKQKFFNKFSITSIIVKILNYFFSLNYIINIPSKNFWIKYSIIPFFIMKKKSVLNAKYDFQLRENIRELFFDELKKKRINIFYNNFYNILSFYLPINYLENFKILNEKYKNIRNLKKIISTHAHIVDDEFKFLLINLLKKKTKIYFYQHGGGYLCNKYSLLHNFEYNCCDKFLSWGNFNKNEKNIFSFYINKLLDSEEKKKNDLKDKNYIIFFKDFFRHNFSSTDYHPNYYLKIYKKFVDNLCQAKNINEIIVRLYGGKNLLKNKDNSLNFYYKKIKRLFLNDVKITYSDKDIIQQSNAANLRIFTYFGTACLEMISLNFPSIIYIDKKFCNIYNEDFYKEMLYFKENNLFFDNQKLMIEFISKIDVKNWWYSRDNQVVIYRFKKLFCRRIDSQTLYKKLINV
jgi:putative transferase (TIGR04331 family)